MENISWARITLLEVGIARAGADKVMLRQRFEALAAELAAAFAKL
jgi:hypothetical protein